MNTLARPAPSSEPGLATAEGIAFFASKALVCAAAAQSLEATELRVGLAALAVWFTAFAAVGVRRLLRSGA